MWSKGCGMWGMGLSGVGYGVYMVSGMGVWMWGVGYAGVGLGCRM